MIVWLKKKLKLWTASTLFRDTLIQIDAGVKINDHGQKVFQVL